MDEIAIFETIEDMARRLQGTGGGARALAVAEAIKTIKAAPGMLDRTNATTALYWLAVALHGADHATSLIASAAGTLEAFQEE